MAEFPPSRQRESTGEARIDSSPARFKVVRPFQSHDPPFKTASDRDPVSNPPLREDFESLRTNDLRIDFLQSTSEFDRDHAGKYDEDV